MTFWLWRNLIPASANGHDYVEWEWGSIQHGKELTNVAAYSAYLLLSESTAIVRITKNLQ